MSYFVFPRIHVLARKKFNNFTEIMVLTVAQSF
jgi:hypothetical protein